MSSRDRSPVKTSSPDGHWEKTTGTRWLLCTIWLCSSMDNLLVRLATTEPGFFLPMFFSPFCHRWRFGSLPLSASGLLSWGHLISSDIVDLIAQILFKLNWAGRWHHWIQWWTAFNWKLSVYYCPFALLTPNWHKIFLFHTVSCFDTICIVKSAI